MIENKEGICPSKVHRTGAAARTTAERNVNERELQRRLERLAPWLKFDRLLRGPLFWTSMAVIGVLLLAVAVVSFVGWVPGFWGRMVLAVSMIFFWASLMTAFAGWMLRIEK